MTLRFFWRGLLFFGSRIGVIAEKLVHITHRILRIVLFCLIGVKKRK